VAARQAHRPRRSGPWSLPLPVQGAPVGDGIRAPHQASTATSSRAISAAGQGCERDRRPLIEGVGANGGEGELRDRNGSIRGPPPKRCGWRRAFEGLETDRSSSSPWPRSAAKVITSSTTPLPRADRECRRWYSTPTPRGATPPFAARPTPCPPTPLHPLSPARECRLRIVPCRRSKLGSVEMAPARASHKGPAGRRAPGTRAQTSSLNRQRLGPARITADGHQQRAASRRAAPPGDQPAGSFGPGHRGRSAA